MNQYGVTVGGPVPLPKFDGRKRHTYFFGYWEGFRSSQSGTQFSNVPTAAQLDGDFSSLLTKTQATGPNAAGQNGPIVDGSGQAVFNGAIYNPYSTGPVTPGQSQLMRVPFPGNIIPKSMISQQSLTYLKA